MLDDFKTELKKLGINRIKKDEARRQSFALINECYDVESKGAPDELEISAMLGAGPTTNEANDNHRRPPEKHQVGRMGTKITNLPSLARFQFPAKSKQKDEEQNGDHASMPSASDRLSWTRQSLGVINWEKD
jgi:hypothetical protein